MYPYANWYYNPYYPYTSTPYPNLQQPAQTQIVPQVVYNQELATKADLNELEKHIMEALDEKLSDKRDDAE